MKRLPSRLFLPAGRLHVSTRNEIVYWLAQLVLWLYTFMISSWNNL